MSADLFADADIVSTYTDTQALEGGVLLSLGTLAAPQFRGRPVNRITRALLAELLTFLFDGKALSLHSGPERIEDMNRGHYANLRETIATKLRYARDTTDDRAGRGVHYVLPPGLWLVANDAGGWTIMRPSDY